MGAAHSCASAGAQLLTSVANGDNNAAREILVRYPRAACYSTYGDNTSPLLVAAGRGNHRLVQLILEAAVLAEGAERAKTLCINHTNRLGQSALMLACMQGHHAVVEYLINNGASPLVYDHLRHNTCLHWAANYSRAESVQRLLGSRATYQLNNGAVVAVADIPCYDADGVRRVNFVNRRNGWGWTALHLAAHKGSISTVRALLRNGALLDSTTTAPGRSGGPTHIPPGSNVLHIAAAAADVGMVRLILETQLATGGADLRGLVNHARKKPLDMLPPLRNQNSLLRHLLRDRLSIFVTQQLLARMQLALERTDGAGGGSHSSNGHALLPLLKRLNLVVRLELAAVHNQLETVQGLAKVGNRSSRRRSSSSSSTTTSTSGSSGCAGYQDAPPGASVEGTADCSFDDTELQALGFEPATSSSATAWPSSSFANVTRPGDAAGDTHHHTALQELSERLSLLQELQRDAARALEMLVSAASAAAAADAPQSSTAAAALSQTAAVAAGPASGAATSSSTATSTAGVSSPEPPAQQQEQQQQQQQPSSPRAAAEQPAPAGLPDDAAVPASATPTAATAATATAPALLVSSLALDGLPDLLRLTPYVPPRAVSALYYAVKAVVKSSSLSRKQQEAAAAARAQLQQFASAAAKNDVMWMQAVGCAPAVWVEQQQQLQHLRACLQAVLQHLDGTHPSVASLQSQGEVLSGADDGDAWERGTLRLVAGRRTPAYRRLRPLVPDQDDEAGTPPLVVELAMAPPWQDQLLVVGPDASGGNPDVSAAHGSSSTLAGPWVSLRVQPSLGLTSQTAGQTSVERVDQVLQRMPGGGSGTDRADAPDSDGWHSLHQSLHSSPGRLSVLAAGALGGGLAARRQRAALREEVNSRRSERRQRRHQRRQDRLSRVGPTTLDIDYLPASYYTLRARESGSMMRRSQGATSSPSNGMRTAHPHHHHHQQQQQQAPQQQQGRPRRRSFRGMFGAGGPLRLLGRISGVGASSSAAGGVTAPAPAPSVENSSAPGRVSGLASSAADCGLPSAAVVAAGGHSRPEPLLAEALLAEAGQSAPAVAVTETSPAGQPPAQAASGPAAAVERAVEQVEAQQSQQQQQQQQREEAAAATSSSSLLVVGAASTQQDHPAAGAFPAAPCEPHPSGAANTRAAATEVSDVAGASTQAAAAQRGWAVCAPRPPAAATAAGDVDTPRKPDQGGSAATAAGSAAAKPCKGSAVVPAAAQVGAGAGAGGAAAGPGDACSSSSEESEAGTCSICMDRVVSLHVSSCSHGLCLQCAYQLCAKGRTAPLCPFCRQPIEGFAGLL